MTGTARIIQGNALDLPLPDESVDLVVTSPPYFGLRSYQDGGQHYEGQIGAEPTPAQFVDALIAATAEMVRVLKPTGSIWVNLGDKYNSGSGAGPQSGLQGGDARTRGNGRGSPVIPKTGLPPKTLLGIPWRYAIRAIDELGLILRAEVIWSKPNGLPESVTDRVRRSHETWFHFTKSPRYFSAVDEIREPHTTTRTMPTGDKPSAFFDRATKRGADAAKNLGNPLGALPGSVWTVPTQPLRVPDHLGIDHFAAFPMEWPRRIIRAWSPAGVCIACGEGRRPVATPAPHQQAGHGGTEVGDAERNALGWASDRSTLRTIAPRTITGYACACPDTTAPTTPAVILDPFGGTGTTALVAKALGRTGISVDLSHDYCRLATWRTNDRDQLAAAMQVDKPTNKPLEGQLGLFGDDAA